MSRLAGSRRGRWAAALWCAFAAGCGGAVTVPLRVEPAAALLCVAVAAALVAAALRRVTTALLIAVLASLLLGGVRGAIAALPANGDRVDAHLGSGSLTLDGTVREVSGDTLIVDASRLSGSDVDATVSGGVLVQSATALPPLLPGDSVEVDASALRVPDRRPGPESEATLERDSVYAVAVSPYVTLLQEGPLSLTRVIAVVQSRISAAVTANLPEPASSLLLGVAFGIRAPLTDDARTPLQDAGLIHIVVVSGLKVVMLMGLIAALGRALSWSPRRTLLVAFVVVASYVLLSGSGPAAVRSALMAGAAMLARIHGRRTDPLPMLALVGALMLGVQPQLVADAGFQLSFLGTAGILLLAEPLAGRIPGPRILAEPFAVTVAAQLATVPVMAGTFGVIALAGPVANALVLPLLPPLIVVGGGAALLATVAPWLAWAPLHAAGLVTDVIVVIARVLTAIPGAAIQIGNWPGAWSLGECGGILAALGALVVLRRRDHVVHASLHPWLPARTRLALTAALCGVVGGSATAFAAARPDNVLHVTVLNVGSAPAVLVQSEGTVSLIDGGQSPSQLTDALGRVLPPLTSHLDTVVVTGGEEASVYGLSGLVGHYSVGTVLVAPGLTPGAADVLEQLAAAGATVVTIDDTQWRFGGALWRCLRYHSQTTDRDDCAVSVVSDSGSALVLGTASSADQDELTGMYATSLRTNLIVTPPGGALSAALLTQSRASSVAVPIASGVAVSPAPLGIVTDRTGTDGDLAYSGGTEGLQPDGG